MNPKITISRIWIGAFALAMSFAAQAQIAAASQETTKAQPAAKDGNSKTGSLDQVLHSMDENAAKFHSAQADFTWTPYNAVIGDNEAPDKGRIYFRRQGNEIDMAAIIRPPFALQSDLHWTTLAQEPFRLIVPRGVKGKDWAALLANEPFVRYDRASFGGRQVDRFLRKMHIAVRDTCELDELDAIVKLVENGVGIAIVPQTAAYRRWPAGVHAIDLGHHTFHRDIGLVHRARRTMSEPAQMLARLIEEASRRRSPPPAT